MQPNNKTKIAMIIGAMYLGVSGASQAVEAPFDLTITTIADLSVTEQQALSFGSSVFTTGSATCTISGNNPAAGDVQADTGIAGATAYLNADLDLAGSGCAGTGRVGIYEVTTASANQAITVTINSVTNADFTFTPNSNCLPVYGTTTGDDTCAIMAPGTPTAVAAVTGDASNRGTGDKTLRFTVGGSLQTAAGGLTAATTYSDVFNIDVIYQ